MAVHSPQPCSVRLIHQQSSTPCIHGVHFHCNIVGEQQPRAQVVVSDKCRGLFSCEYRGQRERVPCGYPPGINSYNCTCRSSSRSVNDDDATTNAALAESTPFAVEDETTIAAPSCAIFSVASQGYLAGLEVLLASLRSNGNSSCEIRLLWHPTVPDSVLTAAEVLRLRCAAGALTAKRLSLPSAHDGPHLPLVMVRVDDTRMQSYLDVVGPAGTAQAMMKLEALHAHSGLVMWLDADMLVLGSLDRITQTVRNASAAAWQVHGSQITVGRNYLNTGMMAFRAPASPTFLLQLNRTVEEMVASLNYVSRL